MSSDHKGAVDADVKAFESERNGLLRATLVAVVAGMLIGAIGAAFRLSLVQVQEWHLQAVHWAHAWPWVGWVLPVLIGAVGAGIARLCIRRQPLASGSGVQHVEAVMRGEAKPPSIWIVPVKFVGGLFGIGTGLALGREGPTVQMGAAIGAWLAYGCRCTKAAVRDLQAALGGAGLAVAFSAPIGGALFVFEEVAHAFRLRLTVVTIVGTAVAITVLRMLLGRAPDFNVVVDVSGNSYWPLLAYAVFGFLLGLLGVVYNKMTIVGLNGFAALHGISPEVRAALVGALVGIVAWFAPDMVGGGDVLSQRVLSGGMPFMALFLILAVRWILGPLSYSAGTPGGLFAPLLLVGALCGSLFAMGFNEFVSPDCALPVVAFSIVGMAAFFTAAVRAPLTGIVLISEMTATTALLLPMMVACVCALLSATWVRGEPIYDTLRRRMLATLRPEDKP